jgi:hypothetical protein
LPLELGDLRLLAAAGLRSEPLLSGLERRTPTFLGAETLRRLIATIGPEQTVLPAVGLLGFLQDVGDQLLVGAVRAA